MTRIILKTLRIGFLSLLAAACAEDVTDPPSTLTFESPITYYSEFDGSFYIPIHLNSPQFAYASIEFTSTYVNSKTTSSDFAYIADRLPLSVYGGSTLAKINGYIADDTVADGNDTVDFYLKETTKNLLLPSSTEGRTTRLVVIDDDNVPANQMNIRLKWSATGSDVPAEDADFDLYLLSNVVINDGIQSSTVVQASTKKGSFESITVDDNLPDGEYYIKVDYRSKKSNVTGVANPIAKLSGFGNKDWRGNNLFRFSFKANELNYYSWYGPFQKSGRSFVLKK